MKFITCYLILTFSLATPLAVSAETSALRVFCQGDDVGAEVSVNGKFKGECPVDIQVSPGKLKLSVEKDGRKFVQDIRMGGGVSKRVDVVFPAPLKDTAQKTNNISATESVPKIASCHIYEIMAASKFVGMTFDNLWDKKLKNAKMVDSFQARMDEIDKNRTVWSDAEYNQKRHNLKRDSNYASEDLEYIKSYMNNDPRKEQEGIIFREIDDIVAEYNNAHGIVIKDRLELQCHDEEYDISTQIAAELDKRHTDTRIAIQSSAAPTKSYGQNTGSAMRNTPPPPSVPKQDTFVDKAAQAMTTEACLKVRDKAMTVCDGTPWPLNEGCKSAIRSQYPCNF